MSDRSTGAAALRSWRDGRVLLLLTLAAVGVAIRLVSITQPFVDAWSWRQSDVAMIAENLYRHGFNALFPQINWAGPVPGYVGTELPLVPLLAAVLYPLFGVQEWIGRGISVTFFAASLPFFYLLVRRFYTARAALVALSLYAAAPLSIFSSRSFMPDTPSLTLALLALWLFTRWLEDDRYRLVLAATSAALALALLVKPFIVTVGCALLYLAIGKYGRGWVRTPRLWALAILALLPPLVWYAHAHRISVSYPPYHLFGVGGLGLGSLPVYRAMLAEIVGGSLTPTVTALAVAGLFVRPRPRHGYVLHAWLGGALIFLITFARHHHQWYALALVPIAAALAGAAADRLADPLARAGGRGAVVSAGLVVYLSLGLVAYRELVPLYRPVALPALEAGVALRRITPPDALVAVADEGDPTTIYYSGRKGWHFPPDFGAPVAHGAEAIRELEALQRQGARYLVFLTSTMWWLTHFPDFGRAVDASYRRLQETEHYVIFESSRLKARAAPGSPHSSRAEYPAPRWSRGWPAR